MYNHSTVIKKRIHFIGIGGVGMSALATLLLGQGYVVSGSDLCENTMTQRLKSQGAQVVLGHDPKNVNRADWVVVSSAILPDHIELVAAQAKGIPILHRGALLGQLMRGHCGISIVGTHGKTTTTALISSIFIAAGQDPTVVLGAYDNTIDGHARLGGSRYFIAETDESDRSFLYTQPMVAVLTNVEPEHLSSYNNDFSQLVQTCATFLNSLPIQGLAVLCIDDREVARLMPTLKVSCVSYGFSQAAEVRAVNVEPCGLCSDFVIKRLQRSDLSIRLNLPGHHNVLNALAAVAVASFYDLPDDAIVQALLEFRGVRRRFQMRGYLVQSERHWQPASPMLQISSDAVTVIEDYGHHPTEIEAVLSTLRMVWPGRRLVLLFQPHRYTRTKALLHEFAQVLAKTDVLLLMDIDPAGEAPIEGIHRQTLIQHIQAISDVALHPIHDISDLSDQLACILQGGDILLLQGAGCVGQLATRLMRHV